MKPLSFRLTLSALVTSLLISSCSSTNELKIREKNLQRMIQNKVDNCNSLYALYSFASYAEIDIFTGDDAEQRYTERANLFKKYTLEVLEISKLRNHFNKAEYIKELERVPQDIDGKDLPDNLLRRIGQRFFPDCGYFPTVEIFNDPPEQEVTSETALLPSTRKQIDIVLEAPSLVFWGVPFQITARSSNGEMDYCIFKFGGSSSMYAETLGKVIATQGIAEITHTLVWNGGLGSTAWSRYWAVCGVDGREIEIEGVTVQGAR